MNVIGFALSNISAQKEKDFSFKSLESSVEFKDPEKEKVAMLKDVEAVKLDFNYKITYNGNGKKTAGISFDGTLLCSFSKEESKHLFKNWKKKEDSLDLRIHFTNLIMRRCAVKALQLQEDLNLPFHPAAPQIKPGTKPQLVEKKEN